jgi:hypothetical protein
MVADDDLKNGQKIKRFGVQPIGLRQTFTKDKFQGCQMVYFKTKNPNLGTFWWALEWKVLVYLKAIWYNLWPFGIVCSHFGVVFLFLHVETKKNLATLIHFTPFVFCFKWMVLKFSFFLQQQSELYLHTVVLNI